MDHRPQRKSRGWFRTIKRKGDLWDVYFKNFHNDSMMCIAIELDITTANQIKEALNQTLSTIDPPNTFTGLDINT